jgi:hypothetical protein
MCEIYFDILYLSVKAPLLVDQLIINKKESKDCVKLHSLSPVL